MLDEVVVCESVGGGEEGEREKKGGKGEQFILYPMVSF